MINIIIGFKGFTLPKTAVISHLKKHSRPNNFINYEM